MSSGGGTTLVVAVVRKFLTSQLSIILIALAVCMGIAAVILTPREEDPQIVVPMADVYVQVPGCSAAEVEKLVTTPLERILWQIDGVEHVYSISRRDMAVVTVRFYVGEDRERSLTKIASRIEMNRDIVPPVVSGWVVKPVEIDDVPIVTAALVSKTMTPGDLRRIGEEVKARLDSIEDLSRTEIVGGYRREIRVTVDPEKLRGHNLSLAEVAAACRNADVGATAGSIDLDGNTLRVVARDGLPAVAAVRRQVVAVYEQKPVYIRDVARVEDLPEEPESYVRFSSGPAAAEELKDLRELPCVTLAFSKKKGTNAVTVARDVLAALEKLRNTVIPESVHVVATRNTGSTADARVNELLSSLFFAVVTVVAVIALAMGWREAAVVAIAVPISFALALFVNYISGYTINRVTLFALILSLGLVVDDPITNVDNIQRHLRMRLRGPLEGTLAAVGEVLPPVIMSTLTIVVSFLPMFFITGMMGPYMRPMAINVPLAVLFSTVSALTFVPWMTFLLLRKRAAAGGEKRTSITPEWIKRTYRTILSPLLDRPLWTWGLIGMVVLLLVFAGVLVLTRAVPLKMLPFDNKNEFQVLVDMPEGATLEDTSRAAAALESVLRTVPEVTDFQSYVGCASPTDFNGLVRHYYFRKKPNLADIRVNIAAKARRRQQSHAIALRLRRKLDAIGKKHGALVKIVEVPPGPPVLSTITVEVTGTPDSSYADLIAGGQVLQERLSRIPGVVEIDDMAETEHKRIDFLLDKEKAALHGISNATVTAALQNAIEGLRPALVHEKGERNPLAVRVRLSRKDRSNLDRLSSLWVKGTGGSLVQLGSIGRFVRVSADQPIYHKNLERVVFVTAETAGSPPAEAILDTQSVLEQDPLPPGIHAKWNGEGEWQITLRVFRDLGIAFGAALVGIYLLGACPNIRNSDQR